ncbi:hypothetical protein SAMN02746073_0067 [Legionella jamestowniensis DSM 19215]|uniref:SPOR domain-containing protein n=2 Tax=Legionella jamestowniensis TaxID=455 RepID=A0A0W0UGH0_9GAMM|nr:hypothetical protein Ljam_1219 [Legionella jamestowniensis]SFM03617.1 hypothetical protein SAMN02746073_0067 [Legionella jamestowniensis DSM 19215]
MMKKTSILAVCLSVGSLSSCTNYQESAYTVYPTYRPYAYQQTSYQTYDGGVDYRYERAGGDVNVPHSYHVGPTHSPASHKDVDSNWVNNQNPQGYTIEIAEGKASQVAGKLYKVPKNDRTAQIKAYSGSGGAYYKGVYGSYHSYEEAQQALNRLPQEIKQGANIKNWGAIQQNSGY